MNFRDVISLTKYPTLISHQIQLFEGGVEPRYTPPWNGPVDNLLYKTPTSIMLWMELDTEDWLFVVSDPFVGAVISIGE